MATLVEISSEFPTAAKLEESPVAGAELVVAGREATELFELVDEALDLVALAIERFGPVKAFLAPYHIGVVGNSAARLELSSDAMSAPGP